MKVISHSNLGRNWDVLYLDTLEIKLLKNNVKTPVDELRPQLVMSNSSRSRRKLAEQAMIRVRINLVQHTQPSNMTLMTQQETDQRILGTEYTWAPNTPGAREAGGDIQQLTHTSENNEMIMIMIIFIKDYKIQLDKIKKCRWLG